MQLFSEIILFACALLSLGKLFSCSPSPPSLEEEDPPLLSKSDLRSSGEPILLSEKQDSLTSEKKTADELTHHGEDIK